MGLLGRLFKSDPRQDLERAETLLARGQAAEALRLAERAKKSGSLAQGHRAESLLGRAREALAQPALEKARLAEESGFLEDAAEWILAARDHIEDEARRAELERRIEDLQTRAEEERKRQARPDFPRATSAGLGADGAEEEPDDRLPGASSPFAEVGIEDRYEALIGTYDDDIAVRYEGRPAAFQEALVLLNENLPEQARATLEELAETHPEDPVYRLERGICRLMTQENEGAREDFEEVWPTFGDEPLDLAGTVSVPGLWAKAMLGLKRTSELLARLDEVALPSEADPDLCYYFALALMAEKKFDPARLYLLETMNRYSQADFPYLLASALTALARPAEAIATLERAVAPSCSPATCGRAPKHVPSLRYLAKLYLDHQPQLGRVEELLSHIAQAQNGAFEAEDHLLLAEYHRQRGDSEAAEEAAAQARKLREQHHS